MEQILLLALFVVVVALASQLARWLKARRPAEAEPPRASRPSRRVRARVR